MQESSGTFTGGETLGGSARAEAPAVKAGTGGEILRPNAREPLGVETLGTSTEGEALELDIRAEVMGVRTLGEF